METRVCPPERCSRDEKWSCARCVAHLRGTVLGLDERLAEALRELEAERKKASGYHRRAQQAEAACVGYLEGDRRRGVSFSKLLALSAWQGAAERADRLAAALRELAHTGHTCHHHPHLACAGCEAAAALAREEDLP